VDYTGGLQEGGPKRIENLVSVTSYPPNPAARAPCTSPAAALPSRQTSPIRRQLIRFLTGWTRWECRVPLREICTTAGAAGMSARKDSWSSCMIIWALRTAPVQEMCIDSSFLASMSAMGSLVLGASKKVLVNPRSFTDRCKHFFSTPTHYEDALVRLASASMIASRCSPYRSAFVGPRPCTLISSPTLRGRASAMAISVASVNTQYAGSC
jgi:hypothetical protein